MREHHVRVCRFGRGRLGSKRELAEKSRARQIGNFGSEVKRILVSAKEIEWSGPNQLRAAAGAAVGDSLQTRLQNPANGLLQPATQGWIWADAKGSYLAVVFMWVGSLNRDE